MAIAYVAIFILIFYITLFPLRGLHLIERDYSHPARLLSDEEEIERTQRSRLHSLRAAQNRVGKVLRRRRRPDRGQGEVPSAAETLAEKVGEIPPADGSQDLVRATSLRTPPAATFAPLHRQTTSRSIDAASVREIAGAAHAASPAETTGQYSGASGLQHRRPSQGRRAERDVRMQERLRTIVGSPTGSVIDDEDITEVGTQLGTDDLKDRGAELERDSRVRRIDETDEQDDKIDLHEDAALSESADEDDRRRPVLVRILLGIKDFGLSLLTPPTISLVLALVCALVKPLKAVSFGT